MSNNSKLEQEQPPPENQKPGQAHTAHENGEASWGDRWKHSMFKLGTYTGINYFINTLLSVAIAYYVERRGDKYLNAIAGFAGKGMAKFGFSEARQTEAFKSSTKGITLTMGGTILVPVIKGLEDHRNALEFRIGHGLDVLQDKLGKGNKATQENLAEYHAIKTAVKTGKPVEGLSDEAMQLIGKQHGLNVDCDKKLSFKEQKDPWSIYIIARAAAWAAAGSTNYTLDFLGLKAGLAATKGTVTKGISKIFPPYKRLAAPDDFSANIVNDAILTVSSSVTQPFVQKMLREKKSRSEVIKAAPECPPTLSPQPENDGKWAAQMQPAESKISPDALKPVEGHVAQVEKSKAAANDPTLAIRA